MVVPFRCKSRPVPGIVHPNMKLKEFEGKSLLNNFGITIPKSILISKEASLGEHLFFPCVVKAQTIHGKRGKAGFVKIAKTQNELKFFIEDFFSRTHCGEEIDEILLEEELDIAHEYYVSIIFDTGKRKPVVIFSSCGGIDIEEHQKNNSCFFIEYPVCPLKKLFPWQAREIVIRAGVRGKNIFKMEKILVNLFRCFGENDLKIAEINPLVETKDGRLIAADAKIMIDDDALFRHNFDFSPRKGFRKPTPLEYEISLIDKDDYHGVAGKTFLELDGDIAVLASGGGASLTSMDALLSYGGNPANYTEYSGNPSRDKVRRLTELTLSKPGIHGLWVVGGTANFTDIAETFQGFVDGLLVHCPSYPIVVRRAGPRMEEGFQILREAKEKYGLDIHMYDHRTPITLTAKIMVELAMQYKKKI